MGNDRQIPGWLRAGLNLLAIFGVLATVMAWVKPVMGCIIVLFAIAYLAWEIEPWVTSQIRRRPIISLTVFMLVGAGVGAVGWWMWKLAASRPANLEYLATPQVIWHIPASIIYGTPLSENQLNAASPTEGTFTYNPPLGTVLPVGRNRLEATFHPKDPSKYTTYTGESEIFVMEAPLPSPIHPKINPLPSKPEVKLKFVRTDIPAVMLVNSSGAVARDMKWGVVLWNRDNPGNLNPLTIPSQGFDWLKANSESAALDIFSRVQSQIKPGDRLFGSAYVDCPECPKGHTYLVFIAFGQGGWFADLSSEKAGGVATPTSFSQAGVDAFFAAIERVPENERIPISSQ